MPFDIQMAILLGINLNVYNEIGEVKILGKGKNKCELGCVEF